MEDKKRSHLSLEISLQLISRNHVVSSASRYHGDDAHLSKLTRMLGILISWFAWIKTFAVLHTRNAVGVVDRFNFGGTGR